MSNNRFVVPPPWLGGGAIGRWLKIRSVAGGIFVAAIILGFAQLALAAPPSDTELTHQRWFESLLQPGERHLPCCSIADCHITTSRVTNAGYEVAIDDSWIAVPVDLHGSDHAEHSGSKSVRPAFIFQPRKRSRPVSRARETVG